MCIVYNEQGERNQNIVIFCYKHKTTSHIIALKMILRTLLQMEFHV